MLIEHSAAEVQQRGDQPLPGLAQLDVSVLIATRNRARVLEQTLTHLSQQQVGSLNWEVIVVDNGSQDGTPEVLARMRQALPLAALEEPMPGKNRALNRALEVARGRLLLFTDDDVVPDPNWVRTMCEAAARWPEKTILAGAITPQFENAVPMWIREPSFKYRRLAFCGFWPRNEEGVIEQCAFGPNFGVSRRGINGMKYSENIVPKGSTWPVGSETEFLQRVEKRGFQTVFIPSAHVQHVIPRDHARARLLMQRAFRAGRSDILLGRPQTEGLVAGVPSQEWKWLVGAMLRFVPSVFCRRITRLERAMELSRALGRVYQYRMNRGSTTK